MAPPAPQWDPAKVLQIDDIFTCSGWAPSKGRVCHNRIALENRELATDLMKDMAKLEIRSADFRSFLKALAKPLLCRAYHVKDPEQHSRVQRQWTQRIEAYKASLTSSRTQISQPQIVSTPPPNSATIESLQQELESMRATMAAMMQRSTFETRAEHVPSISTHVPAAQSIRPHHVSNPVTGSLTTGAEDNHPSQAVRREDEVATGSAAGPLFRNRTPRESDLADAVYSRPPPMFAPPSAAFIFRSEQVTSDSAARNQPNRPSPFVTSSVSTTEQQQPPTAPHSTFGIVPLPPARWSRSSFLDMEPGVTSTTQPYQAVSEPAAGVGQDVTRSLFPPRTSSTTTPDPQQPALGDSQRSHVIRSGSQAPGAATTTLSSFRPTGDFVVAGNQNLQPRTVEQSHTSVANPPHPISADGHRPHIAHSGSQAPSAAIGSTFTVSPSRNTQLIAEGQQNDQPDPPERSRASVAEPPQPTSTETHLSQETARGRKPIAGDCSICCEDLQTGGTLSWCKAQCGQNFHADCVGVWLATAPEYPDYEDLRRTCPYCRTTWVD